MMCWFYAALFLCQAGPAEGAVLHKQEELCFVFMDRTG